MLHAGSLWRKTFSMENLIILSNYVEFILFNIWNGFLARRWQERKQIVMQTICLLSFLYLFEWMFGPSMNIRKQIKPDTFRKQTWNYRCGIFLKLSLHLDFHSD